MLISKILKFYYHTYWIRFLFILFCAISIFGGCSLTRSAIQNESNSKSIIINFRSEKDKHNLKGLVVLKTDSSYFNVFGKLGVFEVNAAKIFLFNDSMIVVDLINKIIYKARFKNISQSIYNVFTGIYTIKEEQFVYTVWSLFFKDINKKDKPEIVYSFKSKLKKSFINLQVSDKQINYFITMKVLSNNKNANIPFNNINKYSNFEHISIEVR